MFTMHPTLLVGPADWDPTRMPKAEFLSRIEELWIEYPSASGAIVYGDSRHHAEMAYLTNFTPKLEPALALISRFGPPQLLVGGGANMLAAAKPLTWVEKLAPLRNSGSVVSQWVSEVTSSSSPKARAILIGSKSAPWALHQQIFAPLGSEVVDVTLALRRRMRCKSPCEIRALSDGCMSLNAAVVALVEAHGSGADVSTVVLAAEHAARQRGAQDVRSLFSLDGGRTLNPLTAMVEYPVESLQVYLAVRQLGYWVEGFVVSSNVASPTLSRTQDVLRSAITRIKPGQRCADLVRMIGDGIMPLAAHPVTAKECGSSLGLMFGGQPRVSADSDDTFAAGDVLSIRVGAENERGGAIVSTVVAVQDVANSILWPASR